MDKIKRARAWLRRFLRRGRKTRLEPDFMGFHRDLFRQVGVEGYMPRDVATDFRQVFLRDDDGGSGQRVLFTLLSWCGDYTVDDPDDPSSRIPPIQTEDLHRWAGKQEVGGKIKTALYVDLTPPPETQTGNDLGERENV